MRRVSGGWLFLAICVDVYKGFAERTIGILRRHGLIDEKYLITRSGGRVLIPVKYVDKKHLDNILYGIKYSLRDCNPPKRTVRVGKDLPSHDRIGSVVIIRENVLKEMNREELDRMIKLFRETYRGLEAIYVKTRTIGEYRVPELRLLWGRRVEEIIHREYGLRFLVLLGRVYFNPRLGEEHHRLAVETSDGERIVDLFAGIGGFTIHIASLRNAVIVANDLNPYCYFSIVENIMLNRRRIKGDIVVLNLDALQIPKYLGRGVFDRVIANLPMGSYRFYHVYDHLLGEGGVLNLYITGRSCDGVMDRIDWGWGILGCRRVLDYGPRIYIYRIDLVKG